MSRNTGKKRLLLLVGRRHSSTTTYYILRSISSWRYQGKHIKSLWVRNHCSHVKLCPTRILRSQNAHKLQILQQNGSGEFQEIHLLQICLGQIKLTILCVSTLYRFKDDLAMPSNNIMCTCVSRKEFAFLAKLQGFVKILGAQKRRHHSMDFVYIGKRKWKWNWLAWNQIKLHQSAHVVPLC